VNPINRLSTSLAFDLDDDADRDVSRGKEEDELKSFMVVVVMTAIVIFGRCYVAEVEVGLGSYRSYHIHTRF
jgi:hypothetical protein